MTNIKDVVDDYIYGDEEIVIDMGSPELTVKANAIDDLLGTLPLSGKQHDALVLIMVDYQREAKHVAFLKGFDMGLKVAMDSIPKGAVQ